MFDTTLNLLAINVSAPDDEALAEGADPEVIVTLTAGLMLPIANPQDPSQPILVATGNYRYRLDSEAAGAIGKQLIDAAERLPKPSNIQVVSSMGAAEATAQRIAGLRG